MLRAAADRVGCLLTLHPLGAVGLQYEDVSQPATRRSGRCPRPHAPLGGASGRAGSWLEVQHDLAAVH